MIVPEAVAVESREPQVATAVLEQSKSVPSGSKLPTCVSGQCYSVDGLAVHDVGSLPDSWEVTGRRYPVITKTLQAGQKVRAMW